jgi:hypothetical protein
MGSGAVIVVNLSGRGDKDVETAAKWFGLLDHGDDAGSAAARDGGTSRSRGRAGQMGPDRS